MPVTLPIKADIATSASDTAVEFPTGSTHPPLRVQFIDGDDNPVDLSNTTRVQFRMTPDGDAEPVVERAASVIEQYQGIVRYDWRAQDVDTPGIYAGRFIAEMLDGTTLKCPSKRPITVKLTTD